MRNSPSDIFRRYARPAAAFMLALSLVGCSSSDDDDDQPEPPAETPEIPEKPRTPDSLQLSLLGRFTTGQFDAGAAEIPAFDAASKRAFVVNAQQGAVDVLDMVDPANPQRIGGIDAHDIAAGAEINSVAVRDGIVALAIQAGSKTDNGFVALYQADTLALLGQVGVGALPDMVTFTPDGRYVLVANEAEPSDDYQIDPEGSVGIIDVSNPAAPALRTAGFATWNGREQELRDANVRIFGPNATAAQDIEPEYIAVSADSKTAWVTLQENNALARIDIASAEVTGILALGFKDHGADDNGLDSNDEDGAIDIRPRAGLRGMYMPDAIASYASGGKTFLVTANEGDARMWGEDNDAYWAGDASLGFAEEFRAKHLVNTLGFDERAGDDLPPQLRAMAAGALLNPANFGWCGATAGDPGACRDDEVLGRLTITWMLGYRTDDNGDPVMFDAMGSENIAGDRLMYDHLYAFGGRSFSVWNEEGELVWDSGDAFERYLASDECRLGSARNIPCKDHFNSGHDEGGSMDTRSDAKGAEPEGIEVGTLGDKTFAFIGLERMGGIMVYDVTTPDAPKFVDYFNSREDWTTADVDTVLDAAGDLGPEGLEFISPEASPTGEALLVVGNEISGTTAVYQVGQLFDAQ